MKYWIKRVLNLKLCMLFNIVIFNWIWVGDNFIKGHNTFWMFMRWNSFKLACILEGVLEQVIVFLLIKWYKLIGRVIWTLLRSFVLDICLLGQTQIVKAVVQFVYSTNLLLHKLIVVIKAFLTRLFFWT